MFQSPLMHPLNEEYAIGAVSLTDTYVGAQYGDIPPSYIRRESERIRKRLLELRRAFLGDARPVRLAGKVVIVVDDGIATGQTLLSTIPMLRKQRPGKLVIAVPVSSKEAIDTITPMVDDVVCPLVPEDFRGVGAFFEDFRQVSDEEAAALLRS